MDAQYYYKCYCGYKGELKIFNKTNKKAKKASVKCKKCKQQLKVENLTSIPLVEVVSEEINVDL